MPACPTCGKDLTYIAQYERWYCYSESQYAPKDFAEKPPEQASAPDTGSHEGHYHCPTCGKELALIAQYDRYYCYAESKYAPKDVRPISTAKVEPAATPVAEEPKPVEIPQTPVTPEPAPAATAPVETPAIESAKTEVEPQPEVATDPTPTLVVPEEPAPAKAPAPESAPPAATESPAAAMADRPELKRDAVTKAKKVKLVGWAAAYELDTTGSRTELRDRLLQYMDEHKLDETEEEAKEEVEEAPAAVPAAETTAAAIPATTPESVAPLAPAAEPASILESKPEPAPTAEQPKPEEIVPVEQPKPDLSPPVASAPQTVERVEPAASMEPPKVAPAPAAPAPPTVEIAKALPCPTCGKDLTYVAKYDRLYCYAEGKYAPRDYGKTAEPAKDAVLEAPKPAPTPPVETRVARPLPPIVVEVPKLETKVANACPTCGRALRYVKEYDRWWCEAEKKYAPKDYGRKNACPTCGKELTWIPEYQRWYCYAEFKYGPKTIPPPPVGATISVERPTTATPAPPVARAQPAARPEAAAIVSGVARVEHLHGKPGAGIGLAATGFALLIVQNLVTVVLPVLGILLYDPLSADGVMITKILILLGFFGFVLALAGVVVGLRSVRSR